MIRTSFFPLYLLERAKPLLANWFWWNIFIELLNRSRSAEVLGEMIRSFHEIDWKKTVLPPFVSEPATNGFLVAFCSLISLESSSFFSTMLSVSWVCGHKQSGCVLIYSEMHSDPTVLLLTFYLSTKIYSFFIWTLFVLACLINNVN